MFRAYDDEKHLTVLMYDEVSEPVTVTQTRKWYSEAERKRAMSYLDHTREEPHLGWVKWLGAKRDQFEARLSRGWPAGVERLLQIATREINPTSIRRRRERGDQGDELDMQAVYRGDLSRAWTRTRRRAGSGVRSLSIVINLAGTAGITADTLFWRGASALRLASALIEAGYSVAIYGAAAAEGIEQDGDREDIVSFVEIKAEDQPLDMDRLAALTAMPGYFRSRLFASKCIAMDMLERRTSSGLGISAPELTPTAIKMCPMMPQDAIIQPPVKDAKESEAWIDSVLQQIEQPLAA